MTGHLSPEDIVQYLNRTLQPAGIIYLHGHLETCGECRAALQDAATARLQPADFPLLTLLEETDPHLTEEEMVSLVAHRLAESLQSDATRHVASCETCADAVAAMESERDQSAAVPIRPPTSGAGNRRWFVLVGALAAAFVLTVLIRDRFFSTAPAPAVVASLRDAGQSVELDNDGQLHGLPGASQEEQSLVRDALKQKSLPAGPINSTEAPGTLLGPDASAKAPFSLISPIETRVLSDRPAFSWQAYSGATAYQVLVTNESFDPLARSARIVATEWQPADPLPRAVPLLWQVRAWHGDEMVSAPAPPAPPARFMIVADSVAARLQQLRAMPQPSHLLAAVICAREGLRDEARKEIQLLANENPGSALVENLRTDASHVK